LPIVDNEKPSILDMCIDLFEKIVAPEEIINPNKDKAYPDNVTQYLLQCYELISNSLSEETAEKVLDLLRENSEIVDLMKKRLSSVSLSAADKVIETRTNYSVDSGNMSKLTSTYVAPNLSVHH
jgi:hypothetical protein